MADSSSGQLFTLDLVLAAVAVALVGYLVYKAVIYEAKAIPNDGLDEPHSDVGERGSWDMEDWAMEKGKAEKKK